jgi:hypothetical protein
LTYLSTAAYAALRFASSTDIFCLWGAGLDEGRGKPGVGGLEKKKKRGRI